MNRITLYAIVLAAFAFCFCIRSGVNNVLFAVNGYGTATVAPKMHATCTILPGDDTSKIYVQRHDGLTTARLVLLCEIQGNPPLFEVTMDFSKTDRDTTDTLSGFSGFKGRWVR